MRKTLIRILIPALIPALTPMLIAGCSGESEEGPENIRKIRVTTAKAERMDVVIHETTMGRIEDPRFTTLAAELPARVKKVHVDVGDEVRPGQLLIELDDTDAKAALAAARANLARIQAQHEAQERLVKRYHELLPKHFVSPTQLDAAEAQLKALARQMRAARAQLEQARNNLSRTRIKAPVAGRVQQRFVAPGDFIGVGKPVLSLAASGAMHVTLPFPQGLLDRIRPGQAVELTVPGSDEVIRSRITEVAPAVSMRSAAFVARADLPPGDLPLHAGSSVRARIEVERHANAVVVPTGAVVLRPGGSVVYRIENGVAHEVPVVTGARLDGRVEIVRGLDGTETLALDGAAYLTDQAAVSIVTAEEGEG